jgi:hypothetical protein
MGAEPQAIINRRVLSDADILIGIFWTRLGTPTPGYASGTVEEIEEHIGAGKPAMLYFSSAPVVLDSVDPEQYAALKKFKESCRERGIYATYRDLTDFRQQVARQLQIVLNSEEFGGQSAAHDAGIVTPAKTVVRLSPEARLLLREASEDHHGGIMRAVLMGGTIIQTRERVLNEPSNARSVAQWEAVLEELERADLIRAASEKREYFKLTAKGFDAAALEKS